MIVAFGQTIATTTSLVSLKCLFIVSAATCRPQHTHGQSQQINPALPANSLSLCALVLIRFSATYTHHLLSRAIIPFGERCPQFLPKGPGESMYLFA
jgi:hypothetical protein